LFRDKNHRYLKISLIALSLLATFWVQAPRLTDEPRVDEDFRSFYWMNKFKEQGLFPNDELRGDQYTTVHLPWGDLPLYFYSLGYDLLFYAASFFVSPLLFSKLLPFLLMPIAVWYLFDYGISVGGRGPATVLTTGFMFLNLASSTALSVISGLQRSFACPLMIALLYYLHRRKPLASAGVVVLGGLIYAPMFLLGAAASGLFFLSLAMASAPSVEIARRGLITLFIAFGIGALVLAPVVLPRILASLEPADVGTSQDNATSLDCQVLSHPRYQTGGKSPLFFIFPVIGRGGLVNKTLTAINLLILAAVSGLVCLVRRPLGPLCLPREIWCILLASLGLFAAAWASIFLTNSFLLYLPSRYTRVGLFLFLSMFVFLNVGDAIKEGGRQIRSNPHTMTWLIGGVSAGALGFVVLYPSNGTVFLGINMKWVLASASLLLAILGALSLRKPSTSATVTGTTQTAFTRVLIGFAVATSFVGWSAYARAASRGYTLDPPPAEREMLAFLETLPKDVLLAGTPCILDNVPLFAKRQILFSCEQISQDEALMREALEAYYAEETGRVLDFCRAQGVDYLVINSHTYSEEYIEGGWLFFEPYNRELLPRVKARDTFALVEIPDDRKVFESGELFVVPCTEAALR
jgi:hypothetical protein